MADLTTERVQFEASLANLLGTYSSGESVVIPTSRMTLINYTKAKLDEIIPEGEGTQYALDANNNITDPYTLFVNAMLDEAAKRVLQTAPLHIIDPVKSTEVAVPVQNDTIGYIPLPLNFVRLVSLKMTDWEREVTEAITTQDKRYRLQRNKYTRGGCAKPVAVFSFRTIEGAQRRVLEYYSISTNHTIDWLYYIQETEAENIQDNLIDALSWMCAGIVLQITGMAEKAKSAFEQVNLSYLNL